MHKNVTRQIKHCVWYNVCNRSRDSLIYTVDEFEIVVLFFNGSTSGPQINQVPDRDNLQRLKLQLQVYAHWLETNCCLSQVGLSQLGHRQDR